MEVFAVDDLSLKLKKNATQMKFKFSLTMFASVATRGVSAFTHAARSQLRASSTRAFAGSNVLYAKDGQAEVVLVGCGAPNRGMGWYHAVQMLDEK